MLEKLKKVDITKLTEEQMSEHKKLMLSMNKKDIKEFFKYCLMF